MPRQLPKEWRDEAVPDITPKTDEYITQVREYELITPLFGGGVETQKADPITIVRATEVRGQLRFWWRATRGGQFDGNLEKMKAAEDAIWGSTSQASQVQVSIQKLAEGSAKSPYYVRRNNGGKLSPYSRDNISPAYASFPLQPDQNHLIEGYESPPVRMGVLFRLSLSYDKNYTQDLAAALWAWETFGGLGARTRRGFGALQIKPDVQAQPKPMSEVLLREWIEQGLQTHVVSGPWPDDVPHLTSTTRFVVKPEQTPIRAWQTLLDRLKEFRQARTGRFGRSRWPEPEAIRRRTSQRLKKHAPLAGPDKFPRAAFGLPIVFQFKDRNQSNPNDPASDPRTTILQGQPAVGQRFDRLSSPLILRPAVHPEGQSARLAIVLEGTRLPPTGLLLKDISSTLTPNAVLTPSEASLIAPLSGNTDVIQAFLNTL